MSTLCGNVIKQCFSFRERHPDLRYLMFMFVPENNQGVLPSELCRALQTTTSDRPTKLCNWILFSDKIIDKDYHGGFCSTNASKTKSSTNIQRLLNQDPPFPCLRFYVSVPDMMVSSFLNECKNEVKDIDMSDNSAISFHTKAGETNDKLNTVYNGIGSFYRYSNKANIRDLCYQRTFICTDRKCRYAACGHPVG